MEESLEKLGIKKADTVMLHSPVDIMQHGEVAYKAMQELLKRGYTDKIGVSVYGQEEIEEMLRYPEFTVTQVPMSLFDQRLISSGTVRRRRDANYTVFVRSVFLQGLFFLDPETVIDPILVEHALPGIRLINEIAASEGMSIAQLAIAVMRDTVGITSLVLGADTPEQVRENISYFDAPSLSPSVISRLTEHFANTNIPEIMKVLSRPKK